MLRNAMIQNQESILNGTYPKEKDLIHELNLLNVLKNIMFQSSDQEYRRL